MQVKSSIRTLCFMHKNIILQTFAVTTALCRNSTIWVWQKKKKTRTEEQRFKEEAGVIREQSWTFLELRRLTAHTIHRTWTSGNPHGFHNLTVTPATFSYLCDLHVSIAAHGYSSVYTFHLGRRREEQKRLQSSIFTVHKSSDRTERERSERRDLAFESCFFWTCKQKLSHP